MTHSSHDYGNTWGLSKGAKVKYDTLRRHGAVSGWYNEFGEYTLHFWANRTAFMLEMHDITPEMAVASMYKHIIEDLWKQCILVELLNETDKLGLS